MQEELRWKCHICGVEREDSLINVANHDRSAWVGLPAGTFTENIRYCSDNPDCERAAQYTFSFIPRPSAQANAQDT